MTLVEVTFASRALDRHVTYAALVPEAGTPPFTVLYQLHGYSDDYRAWLLRSNIAVHAERHPLLIVFPSGENSYYVNGPRGDYEDFIVRDLPAHVQRTFHARPGKAAIGGLSMGGYGAIRLGLKYPDLYQSIAAHSPRMIDELDLGSLDIKDMPRLTFDCGTEDHLLPDSRRLHEALKLRGAPHDYREYPGAHEWSYWEARIADALAHHALSAR